MKRTHCARFSGCKGFTLVETIIVMTVLGIAAAAIVSLSGNLFYGQSANRDLAVGVQIMQECAEQILAVRRKSQSAYTAVTSSTCSGLGNYGGFGAPSVTLSLAGDPSPPSPVTACTNASTTCTATISVGKGGSSLTPITLRLSNY